MYPHLKELLEYINKKNSKVTIPTNGTLLAKKAQTLLGNSVEKVWVSQDGPQEINNRQRGINSYQAAERGILALYEHRLKAQLEYPRIGVHCVVTADNYTYLEEMVNNPELFQYVDDLVEGMVRLMNSPDDFTGPVNIGNPGEFTILQLAQKIIELTNSASKLVYLPLPQDDPIQRKPDITLAKTALKWEPKVSREAGLKITLEYYKADLNK